MGDYYEYIISKKSECKRLNVIFRDIIPSIDQGIKSKDVENLKDILEVHLPKLRDKALRLADKCIRDDGCPDDCIYCNKEFIDDYFEIMIGELVLGMRCKRIIQHILST